MKPGLLGGVVGPLGLLGLLGLPHGPTVLPVRRVQLSIIESRHGCS